MTKLFKIWLDGCNEDEGDYVTSIDSGLALTTFAATNNFHTTNNINIKEIATNNIFMPSQKSLFMEMQITRNLGEWAVSDNDKIIVIRESQIVYIFERNLWR